MASFDPLETCKVVPKGARRFLFESKKKREMYLCAPPIHTDGDQDDDDDDDDGFSLQRYFQTRARLVQKRYTGTRCTLMKRSTRARGDRYDVDCSRR